MKKLVRSIFALVLAAMIAVTPVVVSAAPAPTPIACDGFVGIQPFGGTSGAGVPLPRPKGG